MLRYAIGLAFKNGFPWTTLAINIAGSIVLGLIAATCKDKPQLQLLLGVGVCGGFTTFSTFSIEVVKLLEAKQYTVPAVYVGGSVLGGVMGAWHALRGATPVEM